MSGTPRGFSSFSFSFSLQNLFHQVTIHSSLPFSLLSLSNTGAYSNPEGAEEVSFFFFFFFFFHNPIFSFLIPFPLPPIKDYALYEVAHFVRYLKKGNPKLVQPLWCRRDHVFGSKQVRAKEKNERWKEERGDNKIFFFFFPDFLFFLSGTVFLVFERLVYLLMLLNSLPLWLLHRFIPPSLNNFCPLF